MQPPKQHPSDQRPIPDELVLNELNNYRQDDLVILSCSDDDLPTLTIKIGLDLENEVFAVEEEWGAEAPEMERAWLMAFAAVSSVMRFAAHLPYDQQKSAVARFGSGTEWDVRSWHMADELDWEDVSFVVEVLGTAHGEAASAYLIADVPEGLDVGLVGEPIALLRQYLLGHPEARVANACQVAYSKLAQRRNPLIGNIEGSARVAAQITIPAEIMRELKRVGLVAGPFTRRPEGDQQ